MNILNNLKLIGIAVLIALVVWFYKDYQYQKEENQRQTENASQLRKADSLRFTSQTLTKEEIKDYLNFDNKDLGTKLTADKINYNRIESIISQTLNYRDTTKKEYDITKIVEAIKKGIPNRTPFLDTTKCQTNKGYIEYKNDSLHLVFTEKTFKNKMDAVAYWERRPWSFFGIKTTFLGKKQFTAKTYDQCGKSVIMKIEKKKD